MIKDWHSGNVIFIAASCEHAIVPTVNSVLRMNITSVLMMPTIRHRDKLYKQIKLTNPDSPEHEMLLINLRTYNVILKRSFRIAKQSYFETRFNQFKFDIKILGKL